MKTLVPLDGSQSAMEALKYAVLRRPQDRVMLLYVAPSGRYGDVERGRFVLEEAKRTSQRLSDEIEVETRLEIGDPRAKVPEIAEASGCDLVVMGAHGVNATPHVERVGQRATEVTGELLGPVLLVLPTGQGIQPPRPALQEMAWDEEEEEPLGIPA
jgi:nucleotide-binding universal stress UspA family protein